ncbi:putative bifunctional diguanylate cyclase/phosphodiesterase [Pseudokineococcus sp. 1T1Z-3]|uniref:putative bifunctional diguanylate cyclase/phosphodiesterase n=1 Tax=Pseudokineococcus sp. 1T1Z-3 TaxID=3132745 RepID=UPI0030A818B4
MGVTLSVAYALASLSCLLVLAGQHASTSRGVLAAVAGTGVVAGAGVALLRHRVGRPAVHALVALSIGLAALVSVVADDASGALLLASLHTVVAVAATIFFPLATAAGYLSASMALSTTALLLRGDVTVAETVAADLLLVAVAVMVRLVVDRASSASVDALTGLPNRRGLDDLLDRELRAADRSGEALAVAMLDLDGFKRVNATGGNDAGDAALREVAASWRAALPARSALTRFGGDQFAVLLPGGDEEELVRVLQPLVTDTRRPASAGVVRARLDETPAELLRRADAAVHRAKRAGRGRCVVGADGGGETLSGSALLASALSLALDRGQVKVHYQPLYAYDASGTPVLCGLEALARWVHAVQGPISPAEFVAAAEEHGLVHRLGSAVLERTCRELASSPAAVASGVVVGVNVSGLELVRPGYAEGVAQVLRRTGWPAGRLVLEVTESVVEADAEVAVAALHAVRAQGVGVAVDDFGTGYSCLSRLDDVPANYLKLDRSFTATAHTSPRRALLVAAVVQLSRAMGLGVVAEGVETAEQAEALRALGCDLFQGYHLARPEPLAALAARLESTPAATTPGSRTPGAAHVPGQRRDDVPASSR